ncbi:MAG: chromosome partitioning protein ParA [Eggerthellaceae bacterium]|nr:chromosome partitioning protein ParA [Eggerthellaceae bacterium]
MGKVVLCADSESLQHPELIGLDGQNVEALPWLLCFSSAEETRRHLQRGADVDEVWVASTDDVAAINLAAAARSDNASQRIYLVLFESTGSVLSRARMAGVTGTLDRKAFAERFAREKTRRASLSHDEAVAATQTEAQPPVRDGMVERLPVPSGASAFVLAVVSGSGGAGKSAAAVLAAHRGSARGLRTLLLDCDLQFGDAHHLMGVKSPTTLDDLLDSEDVAAAAAAATIATPREHGDIALFTGSANRATSPCSRSPRNELGGCLAVVAAPRRLERADVVAHALPDVLDALSDSFDLIVVNTGASWTDCHAVLLERSTCTLFLIDQRASSVRACQHALDLCLRCGIAAGSFVYALNRCARGAALTSIDVSCALQGAHVIELAEGGRAVEELLGAGYVDELAASGNAFCESIERMLDEVLPSAKQAQGACGKETGGATRRARQRRPSLSLVRRAGRHERKRAQLSSTPCEQGVPKAKGAGVSA